MSRKQTTGACRLVCFAPDLSDLRTVPPAEYVEGWRPAEGERLGVVINRVLYDLADLRPDPRVANPAWRLTKHGKTAASYDVHVDRHGPHCTCPDFISRRDNRDPRGCKHIAALRVLNLLLRTPRKPPPF